MTKIVHIPAGTNEPQGYVRCLPSGAVHPARECNREPMLKRIQQGKVTQSPRLRLSLSVENPAGGSSSISFRLQSPVDLEALLEYLSPMVEKWEAKND